MKKNSPLMKENLIESVRGAYKQMVDDVEKLEEEIEEYEKEIKELEAEETKAEAMIKNIQEGLKIIESKKGYEKWYEEISKSLGEKQKEIEKIKRRKSEINNEIQKLRKDKDDLNKARISSRGAIAEYEGKTSKITKKELRKDKMSYGQWG